MSTGAVILGIVGIVCVTIIILAGMLMRLHKHNTEVEKSSTMMEGYEPPSTSAYSPSRHDRDTSMDLGTR